MTPAELTPDQLRRDPLPLRGRVAVVTGVSRRAGIGYAIARRLAALGASLFLHHYVRARPRPALGRRSRRTRGGDRRRNRRPGRPGRDRPAPGGRPVGARRAVPAHRGGRRNFQILDILVCNHARSGGDGPLGTLTAAMLDAHWAVNTRSSILLAQAFAAGHDGRPGGRIVFMTSGQDLGPMTSEVAYAASKGALASITRTLADQLADQAITLNTVNPGPVDTGYAPPKPTRSSAAISRWDAGALPTIPPG